MAAIEVALQGAFICLIWILMGSLRIFNEKDKVAGTQALNCYSTVYTDILILYVGLFTSTQKTLGLGIPLINEMFGTKSDVGVLTIPLLIYHPLQVSQIAIFPCLKI